MTEAMMNASMRDWRVTDGQQPGGIAQSLTERHFRQADIPSVRRFAREFGVRAGLGTVPLSDFVLAVSEAAACVVTRGPCTARLRLWASGSRVFCETRGDGLSDRGPGGPVGNGRPDEAEALRRRLLRQLCDYASIESGPDGVMVLASIGAI
jgi:hypothetical protein